MSLNNGNGNIEEPNGVCSLTFIITNFFGLLLYPSKIWINNKWCFVTFTILIKLKTIFSIFRRHYKLTKIFIFTCFFMRCKFVFSSKGIKKSQTTKHHVSTIFLSIMLIALLLQYNATLLLLESLKNNFFHTLIG